MHFVHWHMCAYARHYLRAAPILEEIWLLAESNLLNWKQYWILNPCSPGELDCGNHLCEIPCHQGACLPAQCSKFMWLCALVVLHPFLNYYRTGILFLSLQMNPTTVLHSVTLATIPPVRRHETCGVSVDVPLWGWSVWRSRGGGSTSANVWRICEGWRVGVSEWTNNLRINAEAGRGVGGGRKKGGEGGKRERREDSKEII